VRRGGGGEREESQDQKMGKTIQKSLREEHRAKEAGQHHPSQAHRHLPRRPEDARGPKGDPDRIVERNIGSQNQNQRKMD